MPEHYIIERLTFHPSRWGAPELPLAPSFGARHRSTLVETYSAPRGHCRDLQGEDGLLGEVARHVWEKSCEGESESQVDEVQGERVATIHRL